MAHKVLDLFAGTGAFTLALGSLTLPHRFDTVLANDIWPASKHIYEHNFPNIPFVNEDIHNLNISGLKVDVITAGFPCQPFSIAGRRQRFNDARSATIWRMIDIIKELKPKYVILENVKHLVSHEETILSALDKAEYWVSGKVLNTCEITNLPQNRERVYYVCSRKDENNDPYVFPKLVPTRLWKPILETQKVLDKYYYSDNSKIWEKIKDIEPGKYYQYRRYYLRENRNNVCPTLTANMGQGGHNVPIIKDAFGIRKLTPRECFRLQGFPDNYEFPKILSDRELYQLIGNAVSPKVIRKITNPLFL